MSDNPSPEVPGQKKVIKIQYEELAAKYAAQFVVDRTEETYLLGFSTGMVEDGATGNCVLPIHSRIAISEAGMKKLVALLQDSLKQKGDADGVGARVPRIADAG